MGSGAMFDRIARRYDLLNRVMSWGLDRRWRRRLVESALAVAGPGDEVLDVATGTADVAISMARRMSALAVVGIDPSERMLEMGELKLQRLELESRVELELGDAQRLPYLDNRFAAATIAFGIRNVPDRLAGLREMTRVVRPGGRVVVLELSEPRGPAKWYVHHVVPFVGALISGQSEYRYLQRSIEAFPPPAEFLSLMRQAGLSDVSCARMSFGVAHLFVGTKPR
jgi:demethylmenaquinone methyltransferase/2-methoxy-6-polyprenyl-1,4-benzoquinol methylase